MEDKLKEWKDQWNNGDVKFVHELFELVEKLEEVLEIVESEYWKR